MIGFLDGILKWQSNNNIIINVNGIGYLVEVTDFYKKSQIGSKVSIFIYTYVREDSLDLYGFDSMQKRELFKTLLSVSRVGPKAAMNILSTLSYEKFITAILSEKVEVLKEVSGIGPKTAQRLILELKSKINDLAQETQFNISSFNHDEELYDALNNLGYSNKEIEQALTNVDFNEDDNLQNKLKQILSILGKENF